MQTYSITVRHEGLNKIRVITGRDARIVEEKARLQAASWDEMWERRSEKERRSLNTQKRREAVEAAKDLAERQTLSAEQAVEECEKILATGLSQFAQVDWNGLKSQANFDKPQPTKPNLPQLPAEPSENSFEFKPKFGFWGWLLPSIRRRIEDECKARYAARHERWQSECSDINANIRGSTAAHLAQLEEWSKEKTAFEEAQTKANAAIDAERERYKAGEPQAIVDYCDRVLDKSDYPDFFPRDWTVSFDAENRILVLDYWLPSLADMPSLKAVKYVASRSTFEEVFHKESSLRKLYDDAVYQTCLRTIFELFSADLYDAMDAIVFNGWVNYLNPATGNETRACIMSLQAGKKEYAKVDLAHVDPKACFRSLKGVGSTQLNAMAAVQPIIQLNKEDPRFVASVDVITKLNEGVNVAAIGWEEFEHLIRGVFEREFSSGGGEVKVTQASRDGGVDAIAFDPDPIRGGKIVIQAKRYTNAVDVSAVRDLYGTVVNEGAIKGILVTTSSYGPDAYAFAKDKPITLMDGSNLLFLLSKHGHQARIDLKEAKMLGGSMQRFNMAERASA